MGALGGHHVDGCIGVVTTWMGALSGHHVDGGIGGSPRGWVHWRGHHVDGCLHDRYMLGFAPCLP